MVCGENGSEDPLHEPSRLPPLETIHIRSACLEQRKNLDRDSPYLFFRGSTSVVVPVVVVLIEHHPPWCRGGRLLSLQDQGARAQEPRPREGRRGANP